jgi:outer membrane receptor protein involved in Fe transport
MKTNRTLVSALFAASAIWPSLLAQTTTATPPGTAATKLEEDVYQLSPFEVKAEEDTGYQATQTLAGTRIRTDLKDVASAITVVTKEFMQDIGATDNATLLQYTTNAEVAGTRGTYSGLGNGQSVDETSSLRAPAGAQRVRGLEAADTTRDFFVSDIPWDGYNVDRIDIQRGPNSILFGLGSPAGIVNASIRNAEFRNKASVELRVGSYESQRASVDVNQVLISDVLAVRVGGLWDHEKFRQEFAFENDERLYGAVRFEPRLFKDPSFRTSIKAKFEHGDIQANRPRNTPPNDSITPWFKPMASSQTTWTLDNGMGKTPVNNGYDANRGDLANIVAGNGLGLQTRNTANPNYQPWISAPAGQQQPFWLMDGSSGQTYRIVGGYINPGAYLPNGVQRNAGDGLYGRRYADQFFGLTSLNTYASNANLPLAGSGQYRTASLLDPTVFDFYNTLIDGPNKWEKEKWDAYNINLSQTAWGDRAGVELIYDRQKYGRANEALLGGNPTITIDILKNFQDFYLTNASGETTTNPNFGRPYVISNSGGNGGSYNSDRKYLRGSLFGELRARDFLENSFLVKLLGKHRFNGVYSSEKYFNETRGWNRYANPLDWAAYWNGNAATTVSIRERPPLAFIYLGGSIASRDLATGANIPGVSTRVEAPDGPVYVFDSTWRPAQPVAFNAPWTVPSNLTKLFDPVNFPTASVSPAPTSWTQASNPANYVGWSNRQINLLRYNNGMDQSLISSASKAIRETTSYAGTWQGFWWNDAIVTTVGWRFDEVKGKDVTAPEVGSNRNIRNLSPSVYKLPDAFPQAQIFKDHSTAGGIVLHLNKLLENDPLPINVSLSFNKSNNFQVTSTRRDIYGKSISNPTGKTQDIGVLLSTKDGKYSFRAMKYETSLQNASSPLNNAIGGVINAGLRFRNVFLYKLAVYEWANRETPGSRNTWGGSQAQGNLINGADQSLTFAQGRAREDAAIKAWNEIQAFLTPKGFFEAWGFTPPALSVLTDRSTYEATLTLVGSTDGKPIPASQYMPNPAHIYQYAPNQPQGFTVTTDTTGEGYEFEFTANPTRNWRISINASQTEATRSNVGGKDIEELVAFLDSKLYNADGSPSFAGAMPQFGNLGLSINNNNYNPWRGSYALLKLQEGANVPEVRKWRYNIITNYTFSEGRLKGVGVGGSYRWQDKVGIGYPVLQTGNQFNFDLNNPYYGPTEDAIDLWASYERKITKDINWKIQLNVRNAFATDGLIPVTIQPDGKTWAAVRVKPNQEWFVTNTFSF